MQWFEGYGQNALREDNGALNHGVRCTRAAPGLPEPADLLRSIWPAIHARIGWTAVACATPQTPANIAVNDISAASTSQQETVQENGGLCAVGFLLGSLSKFFEPVCPANSPYQ